MSDENKLLLASVLLIVLSAVTVWKVSDLRGQVEQLKNECEINKERNK